MTDDIIGWSTPTNEAGEHKGLNDGNMEHFNNDPLAGIAHEIPQNAHDAGVKGSPVHIDARKLTVKLKDIPGIEHLRRIFLNCADIPDAKNDAKVGAFFARALKKLEGEEIDVLAITDANTTGLVGPCRLGTAFYTLMKTSGSNVKASDQALGSFGIGKNAPYACSGFRAIFVSTAYKDGEVTRRLVQGKMILTTHYDNGLAKDPTSYWGLKDGYLPIDPDLHGEQIPEWLTAPHAEGQIGTTIFILDFKGSDTWGHEFIAHYLSTFVAAIHDGNATATIDGIAVNSNTIGDLLDDPTFTENVASNDTAARSLKTARATYAALAGEGSEDIRMNFDVFGPAILSLVSGENLPSRVAVVRNGMFITDQMNNLKRFPAMAGFAAVLRFETNEINQLLRRMEPPRHDCFEPNRLAPVDQLRAKAGFKEVGEKVRAELISRLRGEVHKCVNVTELSSLLGEPEDTPRPDAAETNPLGRMRITEMARKLSSESRRKAKTTNTRAGKDHAGVENTGHDGTSSVQTKNPTPNPSNSNDAPASSDVGEEEGGETRSHTTESGPSFSSYSISTFRGIREKSGRYLISFIAPEEALYGLQFEPVGFSKAEEKLAVKSVEGGIRDDSGIVRVHAAANQKVRLSVEFQNSGFNGPVKVVSYAV